MAEERSGKHGRDDDESEKYPKKTKTEGEFEKYFKEIIKRLDDQNTAIEELKTNQEVQEKKTRKKQDEQGKILEELRTNQEVQGKKLEEQEKKTRGN